MKYSRMTSLMAPSSLQDWLEEELESRGIDGVVYTRYILSLLQDDENEETDGTINSNISGSSIEANPNYVNCCLHHNKKQHKCPSNKWIHRRYQQSNNLSSWDKNQSLKWCECAYDDCSRLMNIDQKRSVVVECLKSASEQDFEIESLVDELCAKLKEYKCNMGLHNQVDAQKVDLKGMDGCNEVNSSPKEQAKRYYAAFPALNTSIGENVKPIEGFPASVKIHRIFSEENSTVSERRTKWDGRKIIEVAKKKDCSQDEGEHLENEEDLSPSHQTSTTYIIAEKSRNPIGDITNVYRESNTDINGSKLACCSSQNMSNLGLKVTDSHDYFACFDNAIFDERKKDSKLIEKGVGYDDEWEDEKLKTLAAKFNNNIASLWDDKKSSDNQAKKSIWCFENSIFSPQSSTSPSPKLSNDNGSSQSIESGSHCNAFTKDNASLWETFGAYGSGNFCLSGANVGADVDDWFAIDNSEKIVSKIGKNKTTLTNHGGDSLFVEVPCRKSSNVQNSFFENKQAKSSILVVSESKNVEEDLSESLLTSPKTHFQPIKQESFDDESEEGHSCETDAEVSRLVPCSSICPNNEARNSGKSQPPPESNNRSLSTSLPELTLFMGPFIDIESEIKQNIPEEDEHSTEQTIEKIVSEEDTTTNCSVNEENDFEELCTMLNQVLRDDEAKTSLEENELPVTRGNEWFDSKENETFENKLEENLSWSYWDSFKNEAPIEATDYEFFSLLKNNNGSTEERAFVVELEKEGKEFVENVENFASSECKFENNEEVVYENENSEWLEADASDYSTLATEYDYEWSAGGEYDCMTTAPNDCSDSCHVFYSWNLEKEWQKEESIESDITVQPKKDESKRPCTFFMEGNCRRSDCKFSHDLKSITCKFWEEGSCFKGVLCPFLHGYHT
ncbi:uncharacterized protein B4U79_18047 [Dinothrombium tinctorium]|uniref:C3H1-type domain-containing protein n=1 Tax=Dinothrombium tinctorium TaxID=1965070 RepID=A0A3S3S793_9ACAR|nr:uncharacterized protein B4U79_18047 [Dinothrombium tinctorium]